MTLQPAARNHCVDLATLRTSCAAFVASVESSTEQLLLPGVDMNPLLLPTLAALPWLQGFFAPQGSTEQGSRDVLPQLAEWRDESEDCVASAYGGMSLRADVSAAEGQELVLASYTQGVFVFDHDNHLLAQAQGLPCEGSADELVALAAGDAAIGVPLVVLAATAGGRAESVTQLTMYRVGNGGELQPVFSGEVERHEGRTTRTGTITLVPGGLIYRDPSGSLGLWLYSAELGRYVELFTNRPNV